jgi:transposase
VRGVNRIRDLPAGIFPALERAFDYSSRSPLLPPTYCAPATSWPAGAGRLAEQPREHRAWPETIASIVETTLGAASEQTTVPPSEAITAPLISRLARQLLDLDREIKDLDNQITRTFDEPSHAGSITSVDGFGPILCAQPLADAGDRRAAFGNPGRLTAYVGLAPAPRGSGRVRGGPRRPQRFHLGPRRVF